MLKEKVNLISLRAALRQELRKKGYSFSEINSVISHIDEDSVKDAGIEMGIKEIGDGSILKQLVDAFLKFLQSEQGKALIDALMKLLLGLLGGGLI